MNQALLQLLGFVVLAAIVLATGFGAMGRHWPGSGRADGGTLRRQVLARCDPGREAGAVEAPRPARFRSRRARKVSLRARAMFLLPLPLFFAGFGATGAAAGRRCWASSAASLG